MVHTITLELPDTIMRHVIEQADITGRTAEEILTDWIKEAVSTPKVSLLQSDVEYPIYTPLGGEQTAQELWDYLQEIKATKRSTGE
jgi:hypothetical protein